MTIFLSFLIQFIYILTEIITWAFFVFVLLSWFSQKETVFSAWLGQIVKPLIKPFRWARIGMFDLSFIAAFLVIQYGGNVIIGILIHLKETLI